MIAPATDQPPAVHPDRLPRALAPHDAERALLAAVLDDPDAFAAARRVVTAAAFAWPEHAELWASIERMADAGEPTTDGVLILRAMEAAGASSKAAFLGLELAGLGLPDHASHYVAIVLGAARRRAVRALALELAARTEDARSDVDLAARETAGALLPLATADAAGSAGGFQRASDGLGPLMDLLDARARGAADGRTLGIPSGFPELDAIFHGFRPGELIVIGAGPKMGKSTFSLSLLLRVVQGGHHAGIVSCEMTRDELLEGMLSQASGVSRRALAAGGLADDDYPRIARAGGVLTHDLKRLYIYDAAFPTLADVSAQMIRLKAEHPEVELVVVDYLQLVAHRMTGRRGDEEIAAVCAGLKGIAKRLGLVVIAPAQTNYKETDKRENKRPTPADLQGGSGMAQTANAVLLLYRPAVHGMSADDVLEVDVALSRRTDRATIVLGWDGSRMRVFSRHDRPSGRALRVESGGADAPRRAA